MNVEDCTFTKVWNGEGLPPVGIDIVFIQDKGRNKSLINEVNQLTNFTITHGE